MDDFRSQLSAHAARYPAARMQDFAKLAYQSVFGPGHMIADRGAALDFLRREAEEVSALRQHDPEEASALRQREPIGGGFLRLCLGAPRDFSLSALAALFFLSAARTHGSQALLDARLEDMEALMRSGVLPREDAWLLAYRAAGCPAVHHSRAYRRAYRPAYRVVCEDTLRLLPLLRTIDRLLETRETVNVAIEGGSASGKSTLGQALADAYGANLFHMDDFFLRPEQRTPERFAEPGGNVDHERFARDVWLPLERNIPFDYRVFDCSRMALGRIVRVTPARLRIVEGAYSRHPAFGDPYDLRIFLGIDPVTQAQRILERSGERLLHRFLNEWIPYENAYFAAFRVIETSDIVLL